MRHRNPNRQRRSAAAAAVALAVALATMAGGTSAFAQIASDDEDVPLDRTRVLLALLAVAMFVLCFTPAPIQPAAIIGRH